jgi:hypothetical protein
MKFELKHTEDKPTNGNTSRWKRGKTYKILLGLILEKKYS